MVRIIDVRTKREYYCGHIEGAELFDIMNMMYGKFPELPKDEEIILYCESGNRSMMAKKMMEKQGFTNIKDGGSIEDMMRNGYKC